MKRLLLIVFILWCVPLHAATFYVNGTTGDDINNDCTEAQNSNTPKQTIQAGLNCITTPGANTLNIAAGTYTERALTLGVSGTAGNVILIDGAEDDLGNPTTIINGSTSQSLTFTSASGVTVDGRTLGANVWRVAAPTFSGSRTCTLTANGIGVPIYSWEVTDGGIQAPQAWQVALSWTDQQNKDEYNALAAIRSGTLYVRFYDNSDPNSKTWRAGPASTNCLRTSTFPNATLRIVGRSYITIQDISFVEAYQPVSIEGDSHHITFEDVVISTVDGGIKILENSGAPHDITVNNSTLTSNIYATQTYHFGAGDPVGDYAARVRTEQYNFFKYNISEGSQTGGGNYELRAIAAKCGTTGCTNIVVTDSTFAGFDSCVNVSDNADPSGLTLSGNVFQNSFYGVSGNHKGDTVSIHDNEFLDLTNDGLRFQQRGETVSYTGPSMVAYIYNNKFWNPYSPSRGESTIYFDCSGSFSNGTYYCGTDGSPVIAWFYHNTIIGNRYSSVKIYHADWVNHSGFPNVRAINNFFQVAAPNGTDVSRPWNNAADNEMCPASVFADKEFGGWYYNFAITERPHPSNCSWGIGNNVTQAAAAAFTGIETAPPSNWALPMGSSAAGAGIRCDGTFTLGASMYAALPGCPADSTPDIGAVQGAGTTPPETEWTADEDFESYSIGADINTLNGGSGSPGWNGAWERNGAATAGAGTIQTAPSGMTGKALRTIGDEVIHMWRNIDPISAGNWYVAMRVTATSSMSNLGCTVGVYALGSSEIARVRFLNGNIQMQTGASAWTTFDTYTANEIKNVEFEFNDDVQPDKWRFRVNAGTPSAWTNTLIAFSVLETFALKNDASGTACWWEDITPGPAAPTTGTVSVSLPVSGATIYLSASPLFDWSTTGVASTGNVTITWSDDDFATSNSIATVAYDARPYTWSSSNWTASGNMKIRVCNGAICDDSDAFTVTGLPSVEITFPPADAAVGGSITLTAGASSTVGIAGVQFKVDGQNIGAEDTTAPYSISWDTTAIGNGNHSLTAVARDINSETTTSATVNVNVSNAPGTQGGGLFKCCR